VCRLCREGKLSKPQKRKPGRPKVLTPEVQEKLAALVAEGATIREACKKLRIDRQAVLKERLSGSPLYGTLARATLLGTEENLELAEVRLKRSTNQRISVDRELAHHYRWKASKLLAAYRDRVDVDLKADVRVSGPWEGKPRAEWTELDVIEYRKHTKFGVMVLVKDLEKNLGTQDAQEFLAYLAEHLRLNDRSVASTPILRLPAPVEKEVNPAPAAEPDRDWEEF
jgi:hypothetical protein